MELCASCGQEVAEAARVCEACGAAVAPPAEAVEIPAPADREPEGPGMPAARSDAQQAPVAGATGVTPREIFMATAAVLAGGVLTMALLVARGTEPASAASGGAPAAAASSRPAGTAVLPSYKNSWSTTNVRRWVAGRRTFAVEVTAENRIAAWQRQVTPVLVVRCRSRRAEVFVFTGTPARIEPKTDDHTVRLAFDGGAEASERWTDSADHDALFAPDGAAFLSRLAGASTMAFGFTPHNAPPATAHFNVAGLKAHLEQTRECR